MNLPTGEYLISVTKCNDDIVVIACAGHSYIYRAIGDWGHDAWIESVECYHPGEILEVRDNGWHITIRTTTGYNDIELRAEWGYEAWLKEIS